MVKSLYFMSSNHCVLASRIARLVLSSIRLTRTVLSSTGNSSKMNLLCLLFRCSFRIRLLVHYVPETIRTRSPLFVFLQFVFYFPRKEHKAIITMEPNDEFNITEVNIEDAWNQTLATTRTSDGVRFIPLPPSNIIISTASKLLITPNSY